MLFRSKVFQENWRIRRELHDRTNYCYSLQDIALMEQHDGRSDVAARLVVLSEQIQRSSQIPWNATENLRFQNLAALSDSSAREGRRLTDTLVPATMTEQEMLDLAENIASIHWETHLPSSADHAILRFR